jgi:hypothetical protein
LTEGVDLCVSRMSGGSREARRPLRPRCGLTRRLFGQAIIPLEMRRPGWAAAIIAAGAAAAGVLLWISLSPAPLRLVSDDPMHPATPSFVPSTVIRATFRGSAEPYCPPGRSNCCETWVTSYGTRAPITEVVDFFEGLDFTVRGQPGTIDARGNFSPHGVLVRWAAGRGSGVPGWRKVDISTGRVWGRPEWPSVVDVYAPACRA